MAGARSLPRPRVPSLPSAQQLRRRLLIAAIAALTLAAGYFLWLRDSSLVAVESVTVEGAEGSPAIETALRAAALDQTTLHVDTAALAEAIASDPAVRGVSAEPDFPHGLTVRVDLREPVGYLRSEGIVVAGDGVVLDRPGKRPQGVASISVKPEGGAGADAAKAVAAGTVEGEALSISRVLGAAPAPLLAEVRSAQITPDYGVVVELKGGLELRFGNRSDADLKWRAAAAVLADPNLQSASYLDLSVPDRPVAGGQPPAVEEPTTG